MHCRVPEGQRAASRAAGTRGCRTELHRKKILTSMLKKNVIFEAVFTTLLNMEAKQNIFLDAFKKLQTNGTIRKNGNSLIQLSIKFL